MDLKKLRRSILKGLLRGIGYYIIFYVVLLGLIVLILLPYLFESMGMKGIDAKAIFRYEYFNLNILLWFVVFYTVAEVIKENIRYGVVVTGLINIAVIYIIISSLNVGRIELTFPEYDQAVSIDVSPIISDIFIALVLFTLGSTFIGVAKYYKKRNITN